MLRAAARALRYREHIGVNLLIEGRPFSDNWIYVHSGAVDLARIANYRNFSPAMAADGLSPLTVEYFAFRGDKFSGASDEAMVERAVSELSTLGLIERDQMVGRFVVRSEKAYPLMEIGHQTHVDTIKAWLDQFENLLPIGRAGMFKYNNQDHAMATGLLAARTALGLQRFDPWRSQYRRRVCRGKQSKLTPMATLDAVTSLAAAISTYPEVERNPACLVAAGFVA